MLGATTNMVFKPLMFLFPIILCSELAFAASLNGGAAKNHNIAVAPSDEHKWSIDEHIGGEPSFTEEVRSSTIKVTVKKFENGEDILIDNLDREISTVDDLKGEIQERWGVAPPKQVLVLGKKPLLKGGTLAENGMSDGASVILIIRETPMVRVKLQTTGEEFETEAEAGGKDLSTMKPLEAGRVLAQRMNLPPGETVMFWRQRPSEKIGFDEASRHGMKLDHVVDRDAASLYFSEEEKHFLIEPTRELNLMVTLQPRVWDGEWNFPKTAKSSDSVIPERFVRALRRSGRVSGPEESQWLAAFYSHCEGLVPRRQIRPLVHSAVLREVNGQRSVTVSIYFDDSDEEGGSVVEEKFSHVFGVSRQPYSPFANLGPLRRRTTTGDD